MRIRAIIFAGCALGVTQAADRDTTADAVLGQSTFLDNFPNEPFGLPTASNLALSNAAHAAIAPNGRLYVSDPDNHRVLSWASAWNAQNGGAADRVIGQPDFVSGAPNNGGLSAGRLFLPQGLCVASDGALWVCDAFNHRVLKFNDPETDATPYLADLVIGQVDFVHRDENLGQGMATSHDALPNSILFPGRVVVYGDNNVFIADSGNSRVLHYTNPTSNTPSADTVLGQYGDFTTRATNNDTFGEDGCCPTAENMFNPIGVARDAGGRLWVADWQNHRVLRFDDPLNSQVASAVIGQPGFTSSTPDNGGLLLGLHLPTDVAFDNSGRLFLADAANHRVLVHRTPLVDPIPDAVFGQFDDLESESVNHGLGEFISDANGLFGPTGVAFSHRGDVFIVDTNNSRVLRYDAPFPMRPIHSAAVHPNRGPTQNEAGPAEPPP